MLHSLRIKKFKGWENTKLIKMAPLTLFFGANSSGKSSIGHFLMMLKQTVESSDRSAVFYPGGVNTAVQLGSFREMVFHRDLENKISFEYEWSLPSVTRFKDALSSHQYIYDKVKFLSEVGFDTNDKHSLFVNRFSYFLTRNGEYALSIGMQRQETQKLEYRVDFDEVILKRNKGRAWPVGLPVRFYGFPDGVVAHYQNADFVQGLNLQHEKLFQSISYLGPLRTKAERLYSWSGSTKPESVGYAGENTIAAILAAQGRKVGIKNEGASKALPAKLFKEVIAEKLQYMDLIEGFRVRRISKQRQEYEVKVRAKGAADFVDLPDVGFGISQVLPVLVQCFYAPTNSIIIIEQPEIHLHPRAQSALADVLIDVINSKENGKDRNIQLIIETHSEHFLRRLQRRIAENAVAQEKVSAYFANVDKTPTQLETLKIDEFGNILNWPEKFFGDEMDDIANQTKAAMKKKIAKQGSTK